jgi:sec-independent protein translocase protein TatC
VRLIPRRERRGVEEGRRRWWQRRRRDPEGAMTLLEHLEELRGRLIWVFGAVGVAGIAGWILFERVVERLVQPVRPLLTDLTGGSLIFTAPVEAFTIRLKVAVYVGFAIAFPVVLFHVWRFISPGLRGNEKRYAIPFMSAGIVLFGVGIFFALQTMPLALRFLIGPEVTGGAIEPLLSARQYLDFALLYMAVMGLAFELPVVLMALTLLGVMTSDQLARYRRHVFMAIAVMATVITPADPYSMIVLSAVLYVLYESCIWLSRLLRR